MKAITITTVLCLLSAISFTSCKKKIYGCMDEAATNTSNAATIDDGSCSYPVSEPENVQIEYFSLTFNPGDYLVDYIPTIPFENGDLMILERRIALSTTDDYWITLPYNIDNIAMNFGYDPGTGKITVFARDSDTNQPYQWTSSSTKDFRLAVIKWNGITPIDELSIEALTE